jgi:hypothetical protein
MVDNVGRSLFWLFFAVPFLLIGARNYVSVAHGSEQLAYEACAPVRTDQETECFAEESARTALEVGGGWMALGSLCLAGSAFYAVRHFRTAGRT